jgi:hypothetical protein
MRWYTAHKCLKSAMVSILYIGSGSREINAKADPDQTMTSQQNFCIFAFLEEINMGSKRYKGTGRCQKHY